MDKGTFGESLKREREMRGVALEEISAATRIATRFLQAIENERWDQLPGGVFNRGFVRAVARYLGLDEENTVAEYPLAVGARPSVPVWTGRPPAVNPDQPWLAVIIAVVLVVALLAGGWVGARRILAWRAAKRAARVSAMNVAPPADSAGVGASQQGPADLSASNSVLPDQNENPETAAVPSTVSASSATMATPGLPATDRFELKVETSKKTKVTVVADKDVVYDGTMKAGENQLFSAADHFQVSARDAGALRLELNGKPLPPVGPAGHSGRITLTRDALKGIAGGGN
jgi:cytoskeleton protein RodZ